MTGWVYGCDVMRDEFRDDPSGGRPCYAVSRSLVNKPMSEIINIDPSWTLESCIVDERNG